MGSDLPRVRADARVWAINFDGTRTTFGRPSEANCPRTKTTTAGLKQDLLCPNPFARRLHLWRLGRWSDLFRRPGGV
jgi:hypothetical protein